MDCIFSAKYTGLFYKWHSKSDSSRFNIFAILECINYSTCLVLNKELYKLSLYDSVNLITNFILTNDGWMAEDGVKSFKYFWFGCFV